MTLMGHSGPNLGKHRKFGHVGPLSRRAGQTPTAPANCPQCGDHMTDMIAAQQFATLAICYFCRLSRRAKQPVHTHPQLASPSVAMRPGSWVSWTGQLASDKQAYGTCCTGERCSSSRGTRRRVGRSLKAGAVETRSAHELQPLDVESACARIARGPGLSPHARSLERSLGFAIEGVPHIPLLRRP